MPANNTAATHPAFTKIRSHKIANLHLTLEEYEHAATGARHIHMAADNDENVFLVALRTFPMDSTGVAHILEHTALCGSERYPVRDPFFMMIRRSLHTFMNAFTSSDWTAYPFASKNRKDFDNLLSVYLDCVFFSKLDPLDFAQEGHRLEFSEPSDTATPLVYRGVVYNEMKGAMSSPVSQLWQTLSKHLFPTTTYHYNSGGEPDHIVDLRYDDLLAFYRRHYHPSNAVFATYGNIPASEHQARFENEVLSRFEHQAMSLPVFDEKRYFAPVKVQEHYGLGEDEDTSGKSHIVMGWLLGHSFDLEQNLEAELLASVLLENSASPLQRALEQTELGHAPSPLCGLEDSNREMTFVCGIEGAEPERVAELEQLVLGVIEQVVSEGVSQDRLEAILHQLELQQREIAGDSFPYGLQLIMSALTPLIHGGDPAGLLDLDPVLVRLRERIKDPEYIPGLAKRLLLDNPHRVTLTLAPDTQLDGRRQRAIEQALAERKAAMTEQEAASLVAQAKALEERQTRVDDDSILPKVGIEDVPTETADPEAEVASDFPATLYRQGTNGLVYQQIVVPLPALSEDELALLPLYVQSVSEMGCGDLDYLQMQDRMSAESGGVSASFSARGKVDDLQATSGYFVLSGKALARNRDRLVHLLHDIYRDVRFDELERLRELVAQTRARREQSITGSGHALAMGAASQGASPVANLTFKLGGLQGIRTTKQLDDRLRAGEGLSELGQALGGLHRKLTSQPRQFLIIGEDDQVQDILNNTKLVWGDAGPKAGETFTLPAVSENVNQAWLTSTQVNFCARAYPTVPSDHPDAPILTVLGGFLRNGFLHRAIREQGGAYGGGAGQDSTAGAFRFFSYRDPRLEETLDDFDASLNWLRESSHDYQALEEAILGVIGQIDKPHSPAGEARFAFHSNLFGRTPEQRRLFRERVLAVTVEDMLGAAERWLKPENASTAVIASPGSKAALQSRGMSIHEI
ncbi:insulinase family protein [Hydrocarboniclastica marina]|uniref:Peptidase M16 n=1 Tax=Hydrocarboniclastica marina TaxID=2259620 RepID=A0A4P7XGL5_9ALTE|nr:insulinase family protein [Hydrocarboniclastica marina]MAL98675.1 peptidase M16 [Alteromonadaceae bacterium]QCF25584.1 peptidase M16 [Hydrocarboniclastica marina]|tara:strand:+ start:1176 stop:4100 length:2925 start_codon:yes stop_codon:yes gene_type:complete